MTIFFIFFCGVCWKKLELSIKKIPMLTNCPLAKGERAEIRFADSHPRLRKSAFSGQARKNFYLKGGRQKFSFKNELFLRA
ncbi:MAG: hypothetical protein D4S01_06285 [Dehalococcoidia bacterium]|nr:MAG: hypothetical protein D4S01_06285 [Dehalococcoidia bacterium]